VGYIFERLLERVAETKIDHPCAAVVYSEVKTRIVLFGLVQDSLRTDCFCVLNLCVRSSHRHVKAGAALILDQHNDNFWLVLFRLLDADSKVLLIFV
jgi:hypothetical protein